MKLYLLRHEKRSLRDPTFHSPLLPKGLYDANKLKYILNDLDINLIFSSPFIRVLQTVKPYCDMKRMKVNIEHSIYEQVKEHHEVDKNFDRDNYRIDLMPSDKEYYLKNKCYKSYLPLSKIEWDDDGLWRITNFIHHIIRKYKDTNRNIVIACHGGLIATLLNRADTYPMGGLSLYFDGSKKVFKPINF